MKHTNLMVVPLNVSRQREKNNRAVLNYVHAFFTLANTSNPSKLSKMFWTFT